MRPVLGSGQSRGTSVISLLDSGLDFAVEWCFPDDGDLFTSGTSQFVQAARLALWVPMHDRYHRGHITHIKYDWRCSQS